MEVEVKLGTRVMPHREPRDDMDLIAEEVLLDTKRQ